MTNRANRFLPLLALLFVVSGCFEENPNLLYTVKSRSLAAEYTEVTGITLKMEDAFPNSIFITSSFDKNSRHWHLKSRGKDKEHYDDLCRKHNDMNYYRYYSGMGHEWRSSHMYPDCDFTSVEVYSDKDFDELHPACSNLAGIIRFMSFSPIRFINSNYLTYYHYDHDELSESFKSLMPLYCYKEYFQPATESECYPIDKLVLDLVPEDLVMLSAYDLRRPYCYYRTLGIIHFETMPAVDGPRTITVRMTTDDGKVFEDSIVMP